MGDPNDQDDQPNQCTPQDAWVQDPAVGVSPASFNQDDGGGGMTAVTSDGAPYSAAGTVTIPETTIVGDPSGVVPDEPETPAIFPDPNQHGAPTKPVAPDPHVHEIPNPSVPDQGPYRNPGERPTEPEEPPSSSDSTADKVLKVLIVLGLSIALVPTVIAALADPEPATKLALAGLTVVEIGALAAALGFEIKTSDSSDDDGA